MLSCALVRRCRAGGLPAFLLAATLASAAPPVGAAPPPSPNAATSDAAAPAAAARAVPGTFVAAVDGSPASALLAVDRNRRTIAARIVAEWGDRLAATPDGVSRVQLETMLLAMRADQLLAASLVGSLEGLKAVVVAAAPAPRGVTATAPGTDAFAAKALGDANADLVYTPVSPCRLFDTRVPQGGLGTPALGVRRTYGAITPVASQGGPGGCAAAAGAAVALVQVGTLSPSASGLLQGGAQGAASFPNALLLYQPGDQYGTAVALPLNPANGQFDLVEQFGTADLYGDLLGYFKAASGVFLQGGNAFGATAVLGSKDNRPLEFNVNGVRAFRLEPTAEGPNVVGGHPNNGATPNVGRQTIAGGGAAGTGCYDPVNQTTTRSCANQTANSDATVGGGSANLASAGDATVAGGLNNTSAGLGATVAGGAFNYASGTFATIAGGESNTVAGGFAFAAGLSNTIGLTGTSSVALGQYAEAQNPGCFVFGDASTTAAVGCYSGSNQFVARALGGVWFFTGGSNTANYTGANLAAGSSSWTVWSDRNGKEHVVPVTATEVLDKVVALPVATWNWKTQDATVRHMGPMAQDFHAAFGLGETDRGISTIDGQGVALAAIQGLNARLEGVVRAKDEAIAALAADLDAARTALARQDRRIDALRDLLTALAARPAARE